MTQDRSIDPAHLWKVLDDRLLQKTRVFDLRVQRMLYPDGKFEDDFYYVQSPDWVNVIPITPEGNIILVKQFRHGINRPSLETPGGLVDSNSSPADTAARELAEETGCVASELIPLGMVYPNPAMMTNKAHVFLAKDVRRTQAQNLEQSEDITVHPTPLSQIPAMIQNAEIAHVVVVAAFSLLWLKRPEYFPYR